MRKLDKNDILKIRLAYLNGATIKELAKKYKVSLTSIRNCTGRKCGYYGDII